MMKILLATMRPAALRTLDQLAELLGGLGTVTVTEEGIQVYPDAEGIGDPADRKLLPAGNPECPHWRGAGKRRITQLPNGAQVEVIGTEDEWVKALLPEREGYVHSDYLTITDTGLPSPWMGLAFLAPGAVHFRPVGWDRRCPDPGMEPLPCG